VLSPRGILGSFIAGVPTFAGAVPRRAITARPGPSLNFRVADPESPRLARARRFLIFVIHMQRGITEHWLRRPIVGWIAVVCGQHG
jgi:hypothetical protein